MKHLSKHTGFILAIVFLTWAACGPKKDKTFKVVSFPDFFNFDVPEPWPRWDTAVNWFLEQVADENPEFVMVAGDLVNGHWWEGPKCIEQMGANYYGNWKRRLGYHNLTYYVAIGDHELGDDPWPPEKLALVPHFERVFAENLDMPQNGPDNKKGISYFVRKNNALFITVETFEMADTVLEANVKGEQLEWFKRVLMDHSDAEFIVVQGHVPIFGNPKARSSSMLMLKDSTENEFWKVMVDAGVDAYLCGEFHAVTIDEKDGIWQIVHGSSWGRKIVDTQDYLVMDFKDSEMRLTMKSFAMQAGGDNMWNLNKNNGPREEVHIPQKTKENGPQVTGTLTISKKKDSKEFLNGTGVFRVK